MGVSPIACLSIVVAFLPWVCIFGSSLLWPVDQAKTNDLQGRPPPAVFAIVWTLICILLTLLSLAVGKTYGKSRILILMVVTILCILCSLWLFFDHSSDATGSCMSLAAVLLMSFVLLILLILCQPQENLYRLDKDALQILLATGMSLPITWSVYALLMNLSNANLPPPRERS